MPYTVTINETDKDSTIIVNRLTITVDAIDLHRVFEAINTPPPQPKKPRSDKGKPKAKKTQEAAAV